MVGAGVQVRAVVRVVRPLERIKHSNNRKYPFNFGSGTGTKIKGHARLFYTFSGFRPGQARPG